MSNTTNEKKAGGNTSTRSSVRHKYDALPIDNIDGREVLKYNAAHVLMGIDYYGEFHERFKRPFKVVGANGEDLPHPMSHRKLPCTDGQDHIVSVLFADADKCDASVVDAVGNVVMRDVNRYAAFVTAHQLNRLPISYDESIHTGLGCVPNLYIKSVVGNRNQFWAVKFNVVNKTTNEVVCSTYLKPFYSVDDIPQHSKHAMAALRFMNHGGAMKCIRQLRGELPGLEGPLAELAKMYERQTSSSRFDWDSAKPVLINFAWQEIA